MSKLRRRLPRVKASALWSPLNVLQSVPSLHGHARPMSDPWTAKILLGKL